MEPDVNPSSLQNVWTPKKKEIEIYLSFNKSLKVTDFYSSHMNANDPTNLKDGDITERYLKLKEVIRYTPGNQLTAYELLQHFSNLCESNQLKDWETIMLLCYQRNHIIQSVIDGCIILISQREHKIVADLLSKSWLKLLAPLIVLLTWKQCSCFSDAVLLLDYLLGLGTEINFLSSACQRLVNKKKHMGWCIDKVGEFLRSSHGKSEPCMNQFFEGLRMSSLIFALNETKLITLLKYNEITYLLENQPSNSVYDNQYEEAKKEQDIYCCYYVIKCLIDLIVSSACGTLIEYNGTKLPVTEELISDYISSMRFVMENISSNELKVELLENMFSLLFLRRSDFKHQPSEDIDSDNISVDSNLSRTLSRSLDSLLDDHGDHAEHSFSMAKNDLLNSVQFLGVPTVISDMTVQDVSESSCCTVKSADNKSNFTSPTDMPPGFITTIAILKDFLTFISDDLLLMSSKRKRPIEKELDHTRLYSQEMERRMSKMSNYTSEAQWRLELVSGFQKPYTSRNNDRSCESNFIPQMLGSSESLVYITMKKQNLVQAEQVIKMYNLKGQSCYEEVDFMKELSSNLEKLKTISLSSKSMESQKTISPLDMIRSNASAGKITSEATQIAESLLQHPIAVKGIHEFPMIDSAICIDFLFSVSLSSPICKSLLDLASLKAEICEEEDDCIHELFLTRLKIIKSFLQLMNNKKHSKAFEWYGHVPGDFLTFFVHLPNKIYPELGGFSNKMFQDGKDAFDELNGFVKHLYENHKELIEKKLDTDDGDILMSKATCLFSVFTSDTISKLNKISFVYEYLKSLIKYVNKFSRWQLNYKTNNELDDDTEKSTILKAANPFLVFNEDISNTFGRLLFDWGVPPKKLESFAVHTNIKLVKIIAERCGVFVASSKNQSHKCEWSMLFQKQRLLNNVDKLSEMVTSENIPSQTIETLMSNVIDTRKKGLSVNDVSLEICDLLNISTIELNYIDSDELKNNFLNLSFNINLLNLLFIHSMMLIVSEKNDLNDNPEELLHLLNSPFGRLMFYNHFAYKVGKLGIVSALDLYRNIVKCDSLSSYFGLHVDAYSSRILPLENHTIESTDYNLCFAVLHEILNASIIPIFYPDTANEELKSLPLKYLEENIKISDNRSELSITKFICLHKQCFINYLNLLEEQKRMIVEKEMDVDKSDQSDGDDGYVSNELIPNGVTDNVTIVNNGFKDEGESDDSCVSESNGNDDDVQILLTSFSNFASTDFGKSLKIALEKCYSIKVEKQTIGLSNKSINHDFRHPVVQKAQTFSYMSDDVSRYLEEACQLGGTLIELCLVKNQVLKQLTTIFSNNVLYNSVNEKDKMFSVYSSLQDGLTKFEKFTKFNSIKNMVEESSILFKSFMKNTEHFEFSLPSSLMNKFYSLIQDVFCHKFLHTLSPDQWSEIVPVLLECSFYSQHFWKIIISNLELFVPINNGLLEIVLSHCISELKDLVVETFGLKHNLKRLIILLNHSGNKFDYILHCETLLPIDDIIDLVKICLEDETCDVFQRKQMERYLKKYKWYKEVFDLNLKHDDLEFTTWQQLKQFVEEEPEILLQLLIDSEFDNLITKWCEFFELSENVYEHCLQWKLMYLLNDENIDYLTLQFNLDKIECDELCLRLCNYLITENNGYNCHNLFVIQYMTNMLSHLLDPVEKGKLILNKIGILLIEMIPVELQDPYQCLQNNPTLIVEQLLMNMKIKLAEKALQCIHLETVDEEIKEVSNLVLECDELVARYAQLALDLSGLEQNRSMDCLDDLANSGDSGRDRKWSTVSQSVKKEKENYSPLQPVDRKKWVKDNDAVSCMLCRDLFNMFNRRHHCRHCGRVTCKDCSPFYCFMVRYKRKVRTCVKCYASNYQKSTSNTADENNIIFDIPHDMYVFDAPTPYTLSYDDVENEEMRYSFVYEKAPSAKLCLSIVDLRKNHCAAAGLLIKFSKSVSEYLHENHEGIDLSVVAKMIELILYHAKLKFLKCGDFDGIELTESYCSQIETVKILVESNWPEIPTMLELTQNESLRRLRDQLIENEQFNLATEVTKNSAMDSTINFLMGLSRLKFGDLDKARVYFARCLTSTQGEKLNAFGSNHHYLARIVDELENSLFISINHVMKVEDALLPIPVVMMNKNQFNESILDSKRYEEILFYLTTYGSHSHLLNFCFKNGLYRKASAFIRKEKCTPEQFVIHLVIPSFQEGCFDVVCGEINFDSNLRFWEPFIHHSCKYLSKQGLYHCLYELQLEIKDLFRAALTCVRFFLGIGDPPKTYTQLYRRLKYLNLASTHLENLLKERSRTTSFVVGYSLLGEDKGPMNREVPTADIKHHLYTIELQIEVTNLIKSSTSPFDSKKVLTLFGNGKERAELAVQILMQNCEGSIPLVSKIIQEFKLPTLPIVIRSVRKIICNRTYELVSSLTQQLEQNGLTSPNDSDEIFLQAVKVMVAENQNKSANQFIKLMKNDISKINALILCGHLREAYLEAVKNERYKFIEKILEEARKVGQRNMVDICEKWLKNYKEKALKK